LRGIRADDASSIYPRAASPIHRRASSDDNPRMKESSRASRARDLASIASINAERDSGDVSGDRGCKGWGKG